MNFVLTPIISEKSMKDAGAGKFTFRAPKFVGKKDIKKVVEKNFEVNVLDVATTIVKGKTQRIGIRREEKKISAWKKAVVKLKEGQKIAAFELGEKK